MRPSFPSLPSLASLLPLLGLLTAGAGVAAPAADFTVEIQGCPTASANALSVRVDDITIDVEDRGVDATGHRVFGPGDAHLGSLTIRARRGPGAPESSELYQWWLEASRGADALRTVAVRTLKRDGSEARRFEFFDCFPTRWDPGEYSPSSNVAVETIVMKMGRVELGSTDGGASVGGRPGIGHPRASAGGGGALSGFQVVLSDPSTETASERDAGWETCSGGSLNIEVADPATGGDRSLSVSSIGLEGHLTAGRQALCDWINAAVRGRGSSRSVTIQEIESGHRAGPAFTYLDCFPTRYVFPSFGVDPIDPDSDDDGILDGARFEEEIRFKPIRLEDA